MAYPRHIVAAGGVFRNGDGEALLVKTKDKGWMMPGGQVEVGETLIEALCREVREESGCEVEVERLVGVYTNPQPGLERVMFSFVGRWVAGIPRGDGIETDAAGFYSVEESVKLLSRRENAEKDKFNDALRFDGRVTYRVYTTRPYEVLREWQM